MIKAVNYNYILCLILCVIDRLINQTYTKIYKRNDFLGGLNEFTIFCWYWFFSIIKF